jgi:hypothetical protein
MKWYVFSLFAAMVVFATSCSKIAKPEDLEGTWKGSFSVTDTAGFTTTIEPIKVIFNGTTFVSDKGPNNRPAGGSGVYQISDNKLIFLDQNIWTPNFDWTYILNGTYQYVFKPKSLYFSRTEQNGEKKEYDLKKN